MHNILIGSFLRLLKAQQIFEGRGERAGFCGPTLIHKIAYNSLLLLFILTANGFLPGGRTTIRHTHTNLHTQYTPCTK
jgi:hypothetical protein